jgi:hypothetical protein|tara:strand:+ start:653 stop:1189 length:537 start_codon:yes stop_codon:yes gene_type:complete
MAIIKPNNNTISAITALPAAIPTGKVLQVSQVTKQDTQTFNLTTGTLSDITGMSASITPSSSSNKILIMFTVHIGQIVGGSAMGYVNIDRGGSNIFIGNASDSRTRGTSNVGIDMNSQYTLKIANQSYLDSPSTTSATTYKLRAGGFSSRTFHINKTDIDSSEGASVTSTMTLMEIAG